ncbi:hypothetical protein [Ciceribacter azotifigens]
MLLAAAGGSASAVEKTFGPFTVDDAKPEIISLDGVIDGGAH